MRQSSISEPTTSGLRLTRLLVPTWRIAKSGAVLRNQQFKSSDFHDFLFFNLFFNFKFVICNFNFFLNFLKIF